MKHLLPCLLLIAPFAAAGQPTPPIQDAPPTRLAAHVTSEPDSRALPAGSPMLFAGDLSFRSLYYLFNRNAWPSLPRDGHALRACSAAIDLADPVQAVVVFNGWHLPSAGGSDDIRLRDLRKHLLHSGIAFTSKWPEYSNPGFIVLIQKRTLEWILVARLSGHYLVEDRACIGVTVVPSP
jgi:hypothetical protein